MIFDMINSKIRVLFEKGELSSPEGRQKERMKRILLSAITAAISKVFQMAIPLITVKLSLNYLGAEIYGLWMAVTSFFSMFSFADLGLGYGLQTRLSQATGKDNNENEVNRLISSTYVLLCVVATILLIVFLYIYKYVEWGELLNVKTDVAYKLSGEVVIAIVIPQILNITISLIQRVQLSLQEYYRSNIWQCFGSLLSLFSVYTCIKFNLGPILLITVSAFIPVLIGIVNSIIYYFIQRPFIKPRVKHTKLSTALYMFKTGFAFFILSFLLSIGMTSADNFIVARTIDIASVSSFSIMLKVSQLLNVAIQMLGTPLWSANGEALVRDEKEWVFMNAKRISFLTTSCSVIITIFILLSAKLIFRIWIGPSFAYNTIVLVGMLFMQITFAFVNPYFMILNGAGYIKQQIFIYSIFTPISFVLKYVFAKNWGYELIPWVGVVLYSTIVVPYTIRVAKKICQ